MRGMLDGERPSGERYYATREVRNDPSPVQARLPLLIGGGGERRTLRTVARYADACNFGGGFENVRHKDEVLRRHCDEIGRDPAEIERTTGVGVCIIRDDPAEAKRVLEATFRANGNARPWQNQVVGTPEQVAEMLRPYLGHRIPAPHLRLPGAARRRDARAAGDRGAADARELVRVALLAGGTGGAKLAHGFAQILGAGELSVIVNVGDDTELHGLHVSPDIDSVLYTLAGLLNRDSGWGVAGDTRTALAMLERLGADRTWFQIGDADLATHVRRTELLRAGASLTDATAAMAAALGIGARVLPASDDRLRTMIETDGGELDFQDYFVARRQEPAVTGVRLDGAATARASSAALAAIRDAELVVIGPSNPVVSIGPILALAELREAVAGAGAVAVSPIIAGRALKGPADRMLASLGEDVSALGVARRYAGMAASFVLDTADVELAPEIAALGMKPRVLPTVMRTDADRAALAQALLDGDGMLDA